MVNALPILPDAVSACCEPVYVLHQSSLDEFCNQLLDCPLESACATILILVAVQELLAGMTRQLRKRPTFGIKCGLSEDC